VVDENRPDDYRKVGKPVIYVKNARLCQLLLLGSTVYLTLLVCRQSRYGGEGGIRIRKLYGNKGVLRCTLAF